MHDFDTTLENAVRVLEFWILGLLPRVKIMLNRADKDVEQTISLHAEK